MSGMTKHRNTERHAATARRDHLWVLAVIAAFALYDVWGGWTQIGDKSGFAHGTGWTLTVIVEVYWGYALYAWLAAAPGRRSRRFAMWSAAGVFILSLAGQGSAHLAAHKMPPAAVVVFVSTLPVIVLALIAILIHLRHIDRAEAAEVAQEAADRTELAKTQAELGEVRDAERSVRAELDAVRTELAEVTRRAEVLAQKLASVPKQPRTKKAAKKDASTEAGTGTGEPRIWNQEEVVAFARKLWVGAAAKEEKLTQSAFEEALKEAKAQVGRARVITALQTVRAESEAGGSNETGEVAR